MRYRLKTCVAILLLAGLAACSGDDLPTQPTGSLPGPVFDILDGAADNTCETLADGEARPHCFAFFLAPLVESPTLPPGATGNPNLLSNVVITDMGPFSGNNPQLPPEISGVCTPTGALSNGNVAAVHRTFSSDDVSVDPTSATYSVQWKTQQEDPPLDETHVFRICVQTGSLGIIYRDVSPDDHGGKGRPSNPKDPILDFNNGSNLNIPWIFLAGMLCQGSSDCVEQSCTAQGGSCDIQTRFAALFDPDGPEGDANLILRRVQCRRVDVEVDGTKVGDLVRHLPIDNPQFEGCYEVSGPAGAEIIFGDEPGSTGVGAIIGACFDASAVDLAIGRGDAHDMLQIHHLTTDDQGNQRVESLANTDGFGTMSATACDGFVPDNLFFATGPTASLRHFAFHAKRALKKLVMPTPAWAGNGFGGTRLGKGSPIVWALAYHAAQKSGTEHGTGFVGQPRVLDPVLLATASDGGPVPNATINFDLIAPNPGTSAPSLDYTGMRIVNVNDNAAFPAPNSPWLDGIRVVTDANGEATVSWLLGLPNPNILAGRAFGQGIAPAAVSVLVGTADETAPAYLNPPGLSPPAGLTMFGDHDGLIQDVVDLGVGVIPFSGEACDPSAGPQVDGSIAAGEYNPHDPAATFSVNLSGGSSFPAEFHWSIHCGDLFLAVEIASEDVGELQFDFAQTKDATGTYQPALNDNVLLYSFNSGQLLDRYLTDPDCTGNKQSKCAANDAVQDGQVAAFKGSGMTVVEISFPISTGQTQDFALDPGADTGVFTTVRGSGKGAKGNSQWPGFHDYFGDVPGEDGIHN